MSLSTKENYMNVKTPAEERKPGEYFDVYERR